MTVSKSRDVRQVDVGKKEVNMTDNRGKKGRPGKVPPIFHFSYSFIHLFIHLFIHSFIHAFIHLFIYSFIHLFIHSFIHLFIYK